jgi:putative flippase GtrA
VISSAIRGNAAGAQPAGAEILAGLWRQSLRYLLASLVALAVDVLVYVLLLGGGVIAIAAGVLGYGAGLGVHYALSARYVFQERRVAAGDLVKIAKFVMSGLIGLALTAAIIGSLTSWALCGDYLAKLVAVTVAYVAVFALRRGYVFGADKVQ